MRGVGVLHSWLSSMLLLLVFAACVVVVDAVALVFVCLFAACMLAVVIVAGSGAPCHAEDELYIAYTQLQWIFTNTTVQSFNSTLQRHLQHGSVCVPTRRLQVRMLQLPRNRRAPASLRDVDDQSLCREVFCRTRCQASCPCSSSPSRRSSARTCRSTCPAPPHRLPSQTPRTRFVATCCTYRRRVHCVVRASAECV